MLVLAYQGVVDERADPFSLSIRALAQIKIRGRAFDEEAQRVAAVRFLSPAAGQGGKRDDHEDAKNRWARKHSDKSSNGVRWR